MKQIKIFIESISTIEDPTTKFSILEKKVNVFYETLEKKELGRVINKDVCCTDKKIIITIEYALFNDVSKKNLKKIKNL